MRNPLKIICSALSEFKIFLLFYNNNYWYNPNQNWYGKLIRDLSKDQFQPMHYRKYENLTNSYLYFCLISYFILPMPVPAILNQPNSESILTGTHGEDRYAHE